MQQNRELFEARLRRIRSSGPFSSHLTSASTSASSITGVAYAGKSDGGGGNTKAAASSSSSKNSSSSSSSSSSSNNSSSNSSNRRNWRENIIASLHSEKTKLLRQCEAGKERLRLAQKDLESITALHGRFEENEVRKGVYRGLYRVRFTPQRRRSSAIR